MSFPLGRPILFMLLIALATGTVIALRPASPSADLKLWVFSPEHQSLYNPLIADFQGQTGLSVDMQLVGSGALDRRLQSDFSEGVHDNQSPDAVEVEIGSVGTFFRPPLSDIGFEPIEPYLRRSGLLNQIPPTRLAPWTSRGVLFGVPHDVHPVTLVYRRDLFDQAGIDPPAAKTWPQFQQDCLQFQDYWRAHGFPTRHAVEMHRSKADELLMLLMQRGINPVDDFNHVHLADARIAQTLAFYAQCVAGPKQISGESAGGEGPFSRDLLAGDLCVFFSADWRLRDLQRYGGDAMRGKLRLMPLPRFESTDAPTATWGGTMIAILKTSPHKQEAWNLIQQLYFSPQAIRSSIAGGYILPPLPRAWADAKAEPPDAYFSNQRVGTLLADLAAQIPRRYVTPASTLAGVYLVAVLWKATDYLEQHGSDGLQAACQEWLNEAAADLQRRVDFMSFN